MSRRRDSQDLPRPSDVALAVSERGSVTALVIGLLLMIGIAVVVLLQSSTGSSRSSGALQRDLAASQTLDAAGDVLQSGLETSLATAEGDFLLDQTDLCRLVDGTDGCAESGSLVIPSADTAYPSTDLAEGLRFAVIDKDDPTRRWQIVSVRTAGDPDAPTSVTYTTRTWVETPNAETGPRAAATKTSTLRFGAGHFSNFQLLTDGPVFMARDTRVYGLVHTNGTALTGLTTPPSAHPDWSVWTNPDLDPTSDGVRCSQATGKYRAAITAAVGEVEVTAHPGHPCITREQTGQTIDISQASTTFDQMERRCDIDVTCLGAATSSAGPSMWLISLHGDQAKIFRANRDVILSLRTNPLLESEEWFSLFDPDATTPLPSSWFTYEASVNLTAPNVKQGILVTGDVIVRQDAGNGAPKGKLTIAAKARPASDADWVTVGGTRANLGQPGDIYIASNLGYNLPDIDAMDAAAAPSADGVTPSVGGFQPLGLVARSGIRIMQHDTPADGTNYCTITNIRAALIAIESGVTLMPQYLTDRLPVSHSSLPHCNEHQRILGSVTTHESPTLRWAWSTDDGEAWTGYRYRTWEWDSYLADSPPPFFPLADAWQLLEKQVTDGSCTDTDTCEGTS